MLTKLVIVKELKKWIEGNPLTKEFACRTADIVLGVISKMAMAGSVELYANEAHGLLKKNPCKEAGVLTMSELKQLAKLTIEKPDASRDDILDLLPNVAGRIKKKSEKKKGTWK